MAAPSPFVLYIALFSFTVHASSWHYTILFISLLLSSLLEHKLHGIRNFVSLTVIPLECCLAIVSNWFFLDWLKFTCGFQRDEKANEELRRTIIFFMTVWGYFNGERKRKRLIAEHRCPCVSPWTGSTSSPVRPFTRIASKKQMGRSSNYLFLLISLGKVGKLFFFFLNSWKSYGKRKLNKSPA